MGTVASHNNIIQVYTVNQKSPSLLLYSNSSKRIICVGQMIHFDSFFFFFSLSGDNLIQDIVYPKQ